MICAGTLPHMHLGLERRLRSFQRCCYVIQTYQQPSHSTASQQDFSNKTFRIIHPFHPYKNIEFEIDSERRIAYERRVFFFNTKRRKSSVPLHWTDIGPEDPFVAVSAGRSFFRVEDLLGLVRLLGEIKRANHKWAYRIMKWTVREITPQMLNDLCRILFIKHHSKPYDNDVTHYYIIIKQIFILTWRILCGIYKLSFISYAIINQRR